MDKKEALKIILACSKKYSNHLVNNNIMFISVKNKNQFKCIETVFLPRNYRHLTGVISQKQEAASFFYNKCLSNNLRLDEFELANDGTTALKLQVLDKLMEIRKTAKILGEYNNSQPKLYTDKLAGGIHGCIGFTLNSKGFYVPNTALKIDIRDIIESKERVVCIASKKITDTSYRNIDYCAKDYLTEDIQNCFKTKFISDH